MPKKSATPAVQADIPSYRHPERCKNNPEVDMVTV